MKEQKLTQLILIHPEKFVCEGFKKFGKAQGISVFFLDTVEPFLYLIEDLQPQAILIDSSFVPLLSSELNSLDANKCLAISLGESGNLPYLEKPMNLRDIFGDISKLLASSLNNH